MRILMVTEDIPARQVGGLGKHVVALANALIESGHDVELMGRSDRDYASCIDEVGFNGTFIPGFSFERGAWKESSLQVFIPQKRPMLARRIARAIAVAGVDYDVVHYHGHLPMVGRYLPDTVNFVQTRHDQGSECITHTRFFKGEACRSTNPSDCASCIHPEPGGFRRLVSSMAVNRYRRETAESFARTKTIFVSEFLETQFFKAVKKEVGTKPYIVHNFIDLARIRRHAVDGEIERGSILLVGRIEESKGFQAFLAEIENRLTDGATVHVIGDGESRAALEKRYGGSRIRFHGWQPHSEIVRRTASAHVCVIPSIGEEAFGMTTLEALVLGRPAVALRRGGTPELARYQRYEHQLLLADSMTELADLALSEIERTPRKLDLPPFFQCDVEPFVQQILKIYSAPRP